MNTKIPENINSEILINYLKICNLELTGRGYIPTLELFIEKLQEDETKVEADRLTPHND